jgi:hypothetical protein
VRNRERFGDTLRRIAVVYFIQDQATKAIKIGVSGDPERRLRSLQTSSPNLLTILGTIPGDRDLEVDIHRRLAAHRLQGEWFRPDPPVVDVIKRLLHRKPLGDFNDPPSFSFWSRANAAFDPSQRQSFNDWRSRLTAAYYRLADALEIIDGEGVGPWSDDEIRAAAYAKLRKLNDVMSESPDWMEA